MARYGFWSPEFVKRGHRTSYWSTPDGGEVEICFVGATTSNPTAWPDVEMRGEVVEFLRHGQRSLNPPASD